MKGKETAQASISIDASVDEVWEALTDPDIIEKYFFGTRTSTDWKVGSPINFTGEWEGKSYHDKGTILAMKPKKLIKYTYWSSMSGIEDKPENYVIVTYEISEDDNQVNLTITQENIPDEKTKKHSEENWKKVLGSLKSLIESEN